MLCRTKGDTTTWCCLGVLFDIAADGDWNPDPELNGEIDWKADNGDGHDWWALLPPGFKSEVGLRSRSESTLAKMNDDGTPFHEIADWIEKNQ